ncbi:hypothetical protein WICPIJ_001531 [Wickerhamomyces pijperi]|uniref:Uncharacterized protein n=1 Tax=Wickerhamomyces pijperi TaxID=599730 RepID=A0A9P8TQN4_WICPI|nr:hypothetical protein WICPIJ_001531 [Wickerhamomyces pijperi]
MQTLRGLSEIPSLRAAILSIVKVLCVCTQSTYNQTKGKLLDSNRVFTNVRLVVIPDKLCKRTNVRPRPKLSATEQREEIHAKYITDAMIHSLQKDPNMLLVIELHDYTTHYKDTVLFYRLPKPLFTSDQAIDRKFPRINPPLKTFVEVTYPLKQFKQMTSSKAPLYRNILHCHKPGISLSAPSTNVTSVSKRHCALQQTLKHLLPVHALQNNNQIRHSIQSKELSIETISPWTSILNLMSRYGEILRFCSDWEPHLLQKHFSNLITNKQLGTLDLMGECLPRWLLTETTTRDNDVHPTVVAYQRDPDGLRCGSNDFRYDGFLMEWDKALFRKFQGEGSGRAFRTLQRVYENDCKRDSIPVIDFTWEDPAKLDTYPKGYKGLILGQADFIEAQRSKNDDYSTANYNFSLDLVFYLGNESALSKAMSTVGFGGGSSASQTLENLVTNFSNTCVAPYIGEFWEQTVKWQRYIFSGVSTFEDIMARSLEPLKKTHCSPTEFLVPRERRFLSEYERFLKDLISLSKKDYSAAKTEEPQLKTLRLHKYYTGVDFVDASRSMTLQEIECQKSIDVWCSFSE